MSEPSNKGWVIPVVVGVVSFGGGLAVGYIAGKQQKAVDDYFVDEEQVDEEAQYQIHTHTSDFPPLSLDVVMADHESAMDKIEAGKKAAALAAIKEYQGESIKVDPMDPDKGRPDPSEIKVVTEVTTIEHEYAESVVLTADGEEISVDEYLEHAKEDGWDWEAEVAYREADPDKPYVIHMDEFFTNESEYTQGELYYYEEDDVLVDEDKTPIYDHIDIIGEFKWGHGSDDEDIFYVRNNKTEVEFSILRQNDSYVRAVLGIEEEEEDARPRQKKMRPHREE